MRRRYILAEFKDSANGFVRQVLPQKSAATLRWNATSSAYLTLKDNHPVIASLLTGAGTRCAVWMVEIDGATLATRRLLEGRVGSLSGNDAPHGTVTVPVFDDFADLSSVLGWQAPAAAITGQGVAEFDRYNGPSDTNALAAITANAARLGKDWDVAASAGLGTVGPLELRMDKLADKILTALINDRLQLTIERDTATGRWDVAVRQGQTYPRPLTPQSGVLQKWSWVKQPPTATRCVVGGHGTGVDREYTLVIDTALEAELGVALEMHVNATGAGVGADLAPYGWEALAAAAGKAGLTAVLRETSWFRFPDAYDLGDVVPIQIGALEIEDVITQIEITHEAGSGFSVVPTVGLATADPQARLVGFIQNVATSVAGLERG